jgi:hypothetical protein
MLNKNKVYYSLRQREETRSIQLLEHVDSVSGLFVKPIAIVFPWRAEMIKMFVERLSQQALEKSDQNASQKEREEEMRLSTEHAMRILVAMKLASSIRKRMRIEETLEILYSLSDEETSFWAWKILTYKNKGTSAFKAMYLRK